MKILKDTISLFNNDTHCFTHSDDERVKAIQGLLDLYNKEKEKNKELEKENLEIRDWKYVIDSPIDLEKLKELDLIKIEGKEYISKDKIIAKVIEIKDRPVKDEFITATQGKLNTIIDIESLLDKEE